MLLFHFVFESLLIDSINLNFIERVSKIKRIILIFEKSSTTYPKIAQRRSAEGDAVVPFRCVRIVVRINSINLNFVLWKHTSVKNQTDSIILIFKKIFDHLSKDYDRLFEKSSSSMVKRNRFQSISRDFRNKICMGRRRRFVYSAAWNTEEQEVTRYRCIHETDSWSITWNIEAGSGSRKP